MARLESEIPSAVLGEACYLVLALQALQFRDVVTV